MKLTIACGASMFHAPFNPSTSDITDLDRPRDVLHGPHVFIDSDRCVWNTSDFSQDYILSALKLAAETQFGDHVDPVLLVEGDEFPEDITGWFGRDTVEFITIKEKTSSLPWRSLGAKLDASLILERVINTLSQNIVNHGVDICDEDLRKLIASYLMPIVEYRLNFSQTGREKHAATISSQILKDLFG